MNLERVGFVSIRRRGPGDFILEVLITFVALLALALSSSACGAGQTSLGATVCKSNSSGEET